MSIIFQMILKSVINIFILRSFHWFLDAINMYIYISDMKQNNITASTINNASAELYINSLERYIDSSDIIEIMSDRNKVPIVNIIAPDAIIILAEIERIF